MTRETEKGLYSQKNRDGDLRWYVRIAIDGAMQRFAPHGGFMTRKEAAQFLQHARADISRGKFFPDKFKHTLSIRLDALLTEQDTKRPTRANSKNDRTYRAWWIQHFGTRDAALLTPAHLDQAEQRLTAEGKTRQTIHHYLKYLRERLNLARRHGQLDRSPFDGKKLPAVHNLRTRFYSGDEQQALAAALPTVWREAAELAGLTGLRWSEQFHLTRDQIHLKEGFLELPSTKAKRPQARLLNRRAIALITAQLARHAHPWLYPNAHGTGPISPQNFRKRVWIPACKKAGVLNARWNDWRHTFASTLTMAGHSDRTVAALLGHTTTHMVKRYAHLADAHLRAAIETTAISLPSHQPPKPSKTRK